MKLVLALREGGIIPHRSGPASKVAMALMIAGFLMAVTWSPAASFPYDPFRHARLLEVRSWEDPGGGGTDLWMRVGPDGDRLLMLGYGAPGEVRITDLEAGDPNVLDPAEPGFNARGCGWSMSGDRVVVWGDVDGEPRILLFDADSGDPSGPASWVNLVKLAEVTLVAFLASDVIVAVAGRDANGTSRLIFLEVNQTALRWNHVWEGNATILALEDNGGEIMILDSSETVTVLGGHNWNEFVRFPGALRGGPSSWSMPQAMPWIAGDMEGRVVTSSYPSDAPLLNVTVGEGPVLGVTWTPIRYSHFITATGIQAGGSRLAAWQIVGPPPQITTEWEMCSMEIDARVTMMAPYPGSNNSVYVAAEDGSLRLVRYDIHPEPRQIRYWEPDQVDGRGLEPFLYWYPGGESSNHRFYLNHRGSLIALRGFGAAGDLRVVDRSFETVAELSVPWTTSNFHGLEWSHGDRWLVTWGVIGQPGQTRLVIKAYDTPDFGPSTTFPTDDILEMVDGIFSMEFLPGDTVLAMTCHGFDVGPNIMFVDLLTGKEIDSIPLPEGGTEYELRSDGHDLVVYIEGMGLWTVDAEERRVEREGLDPGMDLVEWDTNASSGWTFVGPDFNVSVWNGSPRGPAITWDTWPDNPMGMVWANGQEGDLVLGLIQPTPGTALMLWRRNPYTDGSWRDLDGYTLVSQLNTSRDLLQLEADPAYEGMVLASFNDGTIGLYHLNVTPYPPPPGELGNLSTGPIYPLDDGSGGDDGDLPWGSSNDWLFPLVLVSTIAALVVVMAVLRHRGRRSAD